ncbi:uncharacterized protein YhaN [Alkalibacillus flavidus]|uniref:Uncharacterized protein YhaN n=1 Tax=Alkalibacillus flavidus TaxID=546021 RepID=A0ABV2KVA9_9BACI
MWIKQLQLVSFGKWRNQTIDLHPQFNYVYGPNESGKSSLRAFVTYVLFGLSATDRDHYTSVADGQLGGRLIITDDTYDYTIERLAHRNRGKRTGYVRGEVMTDGQIQDVLHHVDYDLFRAIFSFQDRDLNAIRHHQSEDIGKILFNLGLTGSDDIVDIEQSLTKQSDKLFKKQGRKPPVNQALQQVKTLNDEIEKTQSKEADHATLYQEAKQLESDIQHLRDEDERLKHRIDELHQLLQVQASIEQVQSLDREMASLLDHTHLSQDMIERYETVKAKRQERDERAQLLMSKMSEVKTERNRLMAQSKKDHFPFTLDEIQEWTVEWEHKQKQCHDLTEQIRDKDKQLSDMRLPVENDTLRTLAVSDYTRQTWSRLAYDLQANAEKLGDLERRKRVKLDELKALETKQQAIKAQQLEEYKRQEMEQQLEQVQRDIASEQVKVFSRSANHASSNQPLMNGSKWIVLLLATILAGAMWSGLFGDISVFWPFVVIGTGGLLSYGLHRQFQTKTVPRERELGEHDDLQQSNALYETKRTLEASLREDDEIQTERRQRQSTIDYVNGELRDIEAERLQIEERLDDLEAKQTVELDRHPWLERYELEQWDDLAQQLINGQRLLEDMDQLQHSAQSIEASLSYIREQLQRFLSYYMDHYNWQDDETSIQLVREYLNQERDINEHIRQQHYWLEELEKQLQELNDEFQPYDQAMQDMLSEVDAANETELDDVIQAFATYKELDEKRQAAYTHVKRLFGDMTDDLLTETFHWGMLERERDELKQERDKKQNELEQKRQRLADCSAHIKQMEEDGRLSDLIHERSKVEDEVKTLAKEWAVLQTAKGLIQETKARYQHDYLPNVLKHTAHMFNTLTGGSYHEVQFSREETLMVHHRNGVWFDVKQLSDGTADQLYVSLRLALNASLHDSKRFPFILDDAFVHFDGERYERMMSMLINQAKEQQMIYFACEPYEDDSSIYTVHINEGQAVTG